MKRKLFIWLLCGEAMIFVLLHVLHASFSASFSNIITFPFEQIGQGLRTLSLSNSLGNAISIIVYLIICLLPIVVLLILRKKNRFVIEDGLLVILSIALFVALYIMINPRSISPPLGNTFGPNIGKAMAGCTIYSILCSYIILRPLRQFSTCRTDKLIHYVTVMLICLNALFVYMVFGMCFGNLLDSIATLRDSNIGNEHRLGVTYVFLLLRFAVDSLPLIINMLLVFAALRLLDVMRINRYSAETVSATKRLSRLCYIALVITLLANIGFNLLQLVFAKSLMRFDVSIQIPLLSVMFMCAVLFLAQFVTESKQLKDDNDMFV